MSDQCKLIEWAREIGREHPLIDFHVHPFDVLTGDTAYQPNDITGRLFARGAACYRPPALDGKTEAFANTGQQTAAASERALLLASRFAYTHTGAKVFADQLDLVGLSGALLLPVARNYGMAETMLAAMDRMFSQDCRFMFSCPYPVEFSLDELVAYFHRARDTWGVRAIKIHSNLIDVDPLGFSGMEKMEATLSAAGALGLAVVLHGGRTPGLEPAEKREYGTLPHLAQVNWGLSSVPVVFAHAGCYGLADSELPEALDMLNSLLEKYPNTMADLSNLEPTALRKVLEVVDGERLIFGSDALYIPVWKAWLRFLEALWLVSPNPERDVVRMASTNPLRCLSLSQADLRQ